MVTGLGREDSARESGSANAVDVAPSSDTRIEMPIAEACSPPIDSGPSGNRVPFRSNSDLLAAPRVGSSPKRRLLTNPEVGQVTRRLRMDRRSDVVDFALGLDDGARRDRHALRGPSPPPPCAEYVTRPCDPAGSRPAYHVMFPQCDPARGPRNPAPVLAFEGLSPNHVYACNGTDPAPRALDASGAELVESRAPRMLGGVWELGNPLTQLNSEASRPDGRLAGSGVRLGPNSAGI